MRKISAVVLTVCIFCMCGAFSVSANENTTHTYTISTDDKWIQTQDAYLPGNIYMRDMGLSAPEDIFINNGAIYVADTGNSRVLIYDLEKGTHRELGKEILNSPSGIFVTEDLSVYVADKGAKAVYIFGADGKLKKTIGRPDNYLFSDLSEYTPKNVIVTKEGNIYVCGESAYEGLMQFSPEGEFEDMARLYGGDFIDLGKGGEFGMVNPLEIIMDADEEEIKQGLGYTVLTRTLQSIKAFIKYYDPSTEEDTINMFSEIVQDTYRRFGIDFTTDFSKLTSEDYPTLKDVYATIRGKLLSIPEKTHEKDVLEKLELKIRPLVKELRYYFDGHTTIKHQSNFIVFNIKELMNSDKNIRNALFFNILKYAWSLTLNPNVNTVLTVDEAHVLISGSNVLGADFLGQIQRRARKYNTGTIIITQQPSDFSDPSVITQGKAIFDNASYYLIMGLKKQAVEDLSKLIDLNDNEKESIKRYNQGEALFVCGSRRMRINVVATEQELDSFGSGGGL